MSEEILFEMYRGDDHALRIVIEDKVGEPIDITGWYFKTTLTHNPYGDDDEDAAVKVDVGPLNNVMATQGVVILVLPHEQTKLLLESRYYFDIQSEANGSVKTVLSGRVLVKADSTQRIG